MTERGNTQGSRHHDDSLRQDVVLTTIAEDVMVGAMDLYTLNLLTHDYERCMASLSEGGSSENALLYVYVRGAFCFLHASDDVCSVASRSQVEKLLLGLAGETSPRKIVSTPRGKIFVDNSFREWGKDDVRNGLHYIIVLTPSSEPSGGVSSIQISLSSDVSQSGSVNIDLLPGRLILHSSRLSYRIWPRCSSSDPIKGLAVFDGYIW